MVCFARILNLDCHGLLRKPRNDTAGDPLCHCEEGVSPTRLRSRSRGTSVTDAAYPLRVQSGNYPMRTNSFVSTVCRFAVGTPSGRALRSVERTLTVGRDDLGAPVQEPPTAYKPVRLC